MSYSPRGHGPQGFQPYGPPPPGYPPYGYGRRPSPALGYVTAVTFVVLGLLALVLAINGWDGTSDNGTLVAALVGVAFTDDLTGNVDFAIAATTSVACTALVFGLAMFARLEFLRWLLAILGTLVAVYYLYAVIWIISEGGGEFVAMALVSFVLWLAATVVAVLPATGRAMRGRGY